MKHMAQLLQQFTSSKAVPCEDKIDYLWVHAMII